MDKNKLHQADARKCFEHGGVIVDPDWVREQLEFLRDVEAIVDQVLGGAALMQNYAIREAIRRELGRMLTEHQERWDDLSCSPPIREALAATEVPDAQ